MPTRPLGGAARPRTRRARTQILALALAAAGSGAAVAAAAGGSDVADAATSPALRVVVPTTTSTAARPSVEAAPSARLRRQATRRRSADVAALRRDVKRLRGEAALLARDVALEHVRPLRLSWSAARLERERAAWRRTIRRYRRLDRLPAAKRLPRWEAWMCIHAREGAWNAPGGTYYGGLQMDLEFQRTYGPDLLARKGTADRWTPLEQVLVAERAYAVRGFTPWPNTARACGVL